MLQWTCVVLYLLCAVMNAGLYAASGRFIYAITAAVWLIGAGFWAATAVNR